MNLNHWSQGQAGSEQTTPELYLRALVARLAADLHGPCLPPASCAGPSTQLDHEEALLVFRSADPCQRRSRLCISASATSKRVHGLRRPATGKRLVAYGKAARQNVRLNQTAKSSGGLDRAEHVSGGPWSKPLDWAWASDRESNATTIYQFELDVIRSH